MQTLNPGKLKLELFCKGIKLDPSCEMDKDGRGIMKVRAGLGSGLEMILPDELYCNIPVLEPFVAGTPFRLIKRADRYVVCRGGAELCETRLAGRPKWYALNTSTGRPMTQVGSMQGTTLAFYPTKVCGFWEMTPRMNCRFCATGLNVSNDALATVDEVVEVCLAARAEGATFCHFNAGFYGGKEMDIVLPFVKAVKSKTKLLVGVQLPPQLDLSRYDPIIDAGADHFSFCYEFQNPKIFAEICPGKERHLTQQAFFNAMEYTAKKMGKGRNSGEIIAGIEPLEDTFKAIDYITAVGAFPTICVFRPVIGTDLEKYPSPKYEDMLLVYRRMYEACRDNGIPTGIAPNVKTSLVVLPYEGRYFRDGYGASDFLYDARLAVLRTLFQAYFRARLLIG
jgi:hypothetical protein